MKSYLVYAHEGEEHGSTVEATSHFLEPLQNPYIAIPLFILILVAAVFILKKLKVENAHIALVILLLTFAGGILGLIFVPPLGMFGVILGFILAMVLSFTGIKEGE